WVERYIIKKPKAGVMMARGETVVDSPNGSIGGFPLSPVPKQEILKSFFVPKLCNLCRHSPCDQACPVGATFRSPDGVVLVDVKYCIGCGFCVQACPYGCRFISPVTHTAEKCTLCYHRITRGLKPACVEVCPTGTRIFGDLKNPSPDNPLRKFYESRKLQTLKPHLGTEPRVFYAGLDGEVR
ncbi:MAG: 4Fe-4S dicluster domain-containing protein, partial [Verrucomicrobiia bacterium]